MKSKRKFRCFLTLIYFFLFMTLISKAHGDTTIPGGSVYGIWDLEGSPYIVQGDIEIEEGEMLDIEPGVVVQFESGGLEINGTLNAVGIEAQMIIFTSAQETPNAGDWGGLDCYNSDIELKWCIVEYATVAAYISGNSPSITDCIMRYSSLNGIDVMAMASGCSGSSAMPIITRCIIEYNSGYGVRYKGYGSSSFGCTIPKTGKVHGELSDSVIRYNGASGIYISASEGYYANGSAYPFIRNNEIYTNGEHGIKVGGSDPTSPTIRNNNIFENTGAGISINNSAGIKVIIYNNIYQNSGVGIYNEDDDAVIDNNEITENLSCGIETSALDSFTGNTLHDNSTYDFYYNGETDQCAVGNDWGTTNPVLIESRIYDQSDNPDLGIILWDNSDIDFLVYYVNDEYTTYDEWCSAPGDDNNDGLTPSTPKATVQSVLSDYDLEPGDIVRIDTGTYNLESNIEVAVDDQGSCLAQVTFEASPYGVTMDRGDTGSGSYGWYLNSCDYVTLTTAKSDQYPSVAQSWMKVMGAYHGLVIHSDRCIISRLEVSSNSYFGIVSYGNYVTYLNNLVHKNSRYGIYLSGAEHNTIENSTIVSNSQDQVVIFDGPDWVLKNNIIHVDVSGEYGIWCDAESTIGASDYNLIYATNDSQVGRYSGKICTTLSEWQEATGDDGNSMSLDPGFVDPDNGGWHLMSTGGSYHDGEWTADAENSPGVDTGNPDDDYTDEPEENGERINLGAYGGTEQASKSGDMDQDGIPDYWEEQYDGLDPQEYDADEDPDGDGLTNIEEYQAGTNPILEDTDGDGMPDEWEVQYDLDPIVDDATDDFDEDGFTNLEEYIKGTDPMDADSHPSKAMPWLPLLLE